FFSSRRRHTRFSRDWSSDVCSSDLDSRYTATTWASSSTTATTPLRLPSMGRSGKSMPASSWMRRFTTALIIPTLCYMLRPKTLPTRGTSHRATRREYGWAWTALSRQGSTSRSNHFGLRYGLGTRFGFEAFLRLKGHDLPKPCLQVLLQTVTFGK